MSNEDIRRALTNLHTALESTDDVDPELEALLKDVDADIHRVLDEDSDDGLEGLQERLDGLAADFAAQHPQAERFLRELVDALGKLGI